MKLIDKDAVVEELKKRITKGEKVVEELPSSAIMGLIQAYKNTLSFIDTLEVKEVREEPVSIWHDANHQPTMYRKYLVRYSNGRVSGSWERHDDGFIPWKDVVKEHGFTHWCYVEDLLKL